MGYVQGTSVGTAANLDSPALSTNKFPQNNTKGNCIVVDIIYTVNPGSTGGMAVTDNAGNTYNLIFSRQNGTTGQWIQCWVAYNIAAYSSSGLGNVVIMTWYPGSGDQSFFHDACIAAHEYSGVQKVSALDQENSAWGIGVGAGNVSITPANNTDLIHGFAAIAQPLSLAIAVFPASSPGLTLRITAGGVPDSYGNNDQNNLVSWDVAQSTAQTQTLAVASGGTGTGRYVGVGLVALELSAPPTPAGFPNASLILDEPASLNPTAPGYTDRSEFLHLGQQSKHEFSNTLSQRGTGTIPLEIPASASYDATQLEGCQIYLQDVTPTQTVRKFAGTIERVTIEWQGNTGYYIATLSVVSFRQLFDALLVPPQTLQYMSAGAIFTLLFNTVAAGVPVALGTVNATFVINTLTIAWDRLSEIFDKIAQAANCIWDIDLATMTAYIQPPSTTAAPYTITPGQMQFGSATFNLNRQDYRNRQIIRISPDAFGTSQETFSLSVPSAGLSANFTLSRPVSQLVAAWITHNTQNSATGTFSANPAPGDTVTIGYPQSGSIYNWVPNAPYGVGQVIVDPANHIQIVKAPGTSGATQPTWNDTGGTTNDGPGSPEQPGFGSTVVWQDLGLSGAGGIGASVYTFVAALDNTQWGQVLIGATYNQTCQNLADAINCNALTQGQTFSWPTWECPLVNAAYGGGASLTISNKAPGGGYISSLMKSSSAFSWSGSETSGGSTSGGTIELSVAQVGSSNTANVSYTPGSNVLGVFINGSATFSGSAYISFAYYREGNDVIVVENTAQVLLRSAIENGTGEYQQLYTDTSITSNTEALQYVQAILAAYDSIPISFSFEVLVPGLQPGQLLTITLAAPAPANLIDLINGTYFVQEVSSELVPIPLNRRWMDQTAVPGGGHYRDTVTVVNESQVLSFIAFWQGLAGGGGGSSEIGAIGASAPAPSGSSTSAPSVDVPVTPGLNGVASFDVATGGSFGITLTGTTLNGGISAGATSLVVNTTVLDNTACPFTFSWADGSTGTCTAISGMTWTVAATTNAQLNGAVINTPLTIATPTYGGAPLPSGQPFNLDLYQDATGGRLLPAFASGFASDTGSRIQSPPIQYNTTPGTVTALAFKKYPSGNIVLQSGSSGGVF